MFLYDPALTVRMSTDCALTSSSVGLTAFFWIADPNSADFLDIRGDLIRNVKQRFDDAGITTPTRKWNSPATSGPLLPLIASKSGLTRSKRKQIKILTTAAAIRFSLPDDVGYTRPQAVRCDLSALAVWAALLSITLLGDSLSSLSAPEHNCHLHQRFVFLAHH